MTSPVTFTWETRAKTAVIVFKSNEEKKHQMTKGSEIKYTYITTLLPGKYYYYFIIDNKRMIDYSKTIEKIKGETFNTITIQPNPKPNIVSRSKHGIETIFPIDYLIDIDKQFSASGIDNMSEWHTHLEVKSGYSLLSNNNNDNHNDNHNDNDNKTLSSFMKKDNNTLHDISNTFSMRKENTIHKMDNSNAIELNSNPFSINANNKVIVYNYEDQYFIPMEMMNSELKDLNLIKFKHCVNKKEYTMCKDDIFYQKVDNCIINNNPYGNLIEMKEVNELSILKNIQIRLRNNRTYMHISHYIFICFYYGVLQTDRDFFLSEYAFKRQDNEVLLIRSFAFNNQNQFNFKEDDELFIIRKYIEVNLSHNHWRHYHVIAEFIRIISIKMKYMVRLGFNEDSRGATISFIPSMSSYLSSSDFYLQSIFYNKQSIDMLSKPRQENHQASNSKINDECIHKAFSSLIFKNNPGSKELSMLFNNIYDILMLTQYNLLKSIKQLLIDLNAQSKYQHVIKLMVVSYIALNYNAIFINESNTKLFSSINIGMINEKNMIYYSNVVILIMIKYINHLIQEGLNDKSNAKGIKHNIIICYNKTEFDEDDVLLNEVIKRRSMTYNLTDLNKNSISNYYRFYLQENIAKFDSNVTQSDLKFISLIENIYELDFLSFLSTQSNSAQSKKSMILNAFNYSCQLTLDIFEEGEMEFASIKQIWRFDLGESFETFGTDQEKVSHFFQITQILDYIKSIQGFDTNNSINGNFFRSYSIKDFFNYYLPILRDIDTKYNTENDYSCALNKFVSDIQGHLSFKENYNITPSRIDINYNTFEIIMSLLKNVYCDHIQVLQSRSKSRFIVEIVTQLRKSVLKLQFAWRRVLYSKYTQMSQRECLNRLILKYKAKDQMLLMYIIKTQREMASLENDKLINNNLDTISSCSSIKNKKAQNDPMLNNNNTNSNLTMNIKQIKDAKPKNAHINTNNNNNQYLTQSSILKKNSSLNTSNTRNEINSLKEKLTESREEYKELVNVLIEYEKKLENFIGIINSNQEVKNVLNKNGIQIN